MGHVLPVLKSGVNHMANNYSSDPDKASYVSNPSTPSSGQSGPGGTLPEFLVPSSQPALPASAVPAPPSGGFGNSGPRRLPPGMVLSGGRYRNEKLIAAGGMGAVYRAMDTRFDRPCAVKEMLDDFQTDGERAQAVEWFKREATLLLDLNHPCIPRVRDFFVEEGRHYLVMDYIDGRTLGDLLEQEGNVVGVNEARGVVEARVRSWSRQLCSVLDYLHHQAPPIIFRDLKPSNIMVTAKDEVKLIDFGIARTFQSQRQSTIIMTIGYAPPEQLHGMPEPRSDIYALGATMYRLLTHHDAANNKPSIFSFPPVRTLRPDVSPAFEQVLMKALAPALELRWGSADEMERALVNLPPITSQPQLSMSRQNVSANLNNPLTPQSGGSGPSRPNTTFGTTGPAGTHILAAQNFLRLNNLDGAHKALAQAFQFEPNNALVHKVYGQVFARSQPPALNQAADAYMRSLQLNPNDPETHRLYGDVLLWRRQLPGAIQEYTQALKLNPNDVEAHQMLAQCYEGTNQLDAALREYQEAVRLSPKQPGLHYSIGQLALRLGNLTLSERAFVQVLILNAADTRTRFLLSQVYEREKKLDAAFTQCSYVLESEPNNTAAQAMLQRLRVLLGR